MTSTFSNANYYARMAVAGEASEGAFTALFPRHSRMGLDRPDMNVAAIPVLARCAPDFMCEDALVECMGIGRTQVLKFKVEKAFALNQWQAIHNVDLFVYDSHRRRWWRAPLKEWMEACIEHADTDRFPDNNKLYFKLHADHFPTQPTPMPRGGGEVPV